MTLYVGNAKELAQIALDHELYHREDWMLCPRLKRVVESGTGQVILAYMEGNPVGVLLASTGGHLMFYVKPEYRGKDLAREMHEGLKELLPDYCVTQWVGIAYSQESFRFFQRLNIISTNQEPYHVKEWYLLCEKSELSGESAHHRGDQTFYVADQASLGLEARRRHLLLKYGKPFFEIVSDGRVVFYTGHLRSVSAIENEWAFHQKARAAMVEEWNARLDKEILGCPNDVQLSQTVQAA